MSLDWVRFVLTVAFYVSLTTAVVIGIRASAKDPDAAGRRMFGGRVPRPPNGVLALWSLAIVLGIAHMTLLWV